MHRALLAALPLTLTLSALALADGPGDNVVENVRRIPKLGVEVPADARKKLEARLGELATAIDKIKSQATAKKDAGTLALLPDVQGLLNRSWDGVTPTTSLELADLILEKAEVAVVPGEAFGPSGYLRLSYALGDDQLLEGIQRLQRLFA